MANLSKEYFIQQLKGLEERSKIHTDKGVTALKIHTEQEIASLARMVSNRFNDIERALDVREKFKS